MQTFKQYADIQVELSDESMQIVRMNCQTRVSRYPGGIVK